MGVKSLETCAHSSARDTWTAMGGIIPPALPLLPTSTTSLLRKGHHTEANVPWTTLLVHWIGCPRLTATKNPTRPGMSTLQPPTVDIGRPTRQRKRVPSHLATTSTRVHRNAPGRWPPGGGFNSQSQRPYCRKCTVLYPAPDAIPMPNLALPGTTQCHPPSSAAPIVLPVARSPELTMLARIAKATCMIF